METDKGYIMNRGRCYVLLFQLERDGLSVIRIIWAVALMSLWSWMVESLVESAEVGGEVRGRWSGRRKRAEMGGKEEGHQGESKVGTLVGEGVEKAAKEEDVMLEESFVHVVHEGDASSTERMRKSGRD